METVKLSNGVEMPMEGFGVFQVPESQCEQVVANAIAAGYRLIDTASSYQNEKAVGRAIAGCGVPREELFITTKAYIQQMGYENTKRAFQESLDNLGLDYLDLYLIHMPFGDYYGSWRALEELYQAGKIRAIGVSNFRPHHLKALLETEVAPMVNQIEFHPGCQQRETLAFCRDHGILVEAWSPLGRGRVLDHPTLTAIAQNHGKTPAQICLRWCLEQGVLPLPKSVTPARMAENRDLFTFALTPGDMAQIAALPPFGGSGHDPDQLDF